MAGKYGPDGHENQCQRAQGFDPDRMNELNGNKLGRSQQHNYDEAGDRIWREEEIIKEHPIPDRRKATKGIRGAFHLVIGKIQTAGYDDDGTRDKRIRHWHQIRFHESESRDKDIGRIVDDKIQTVATPIGQNLRDFHFARNRSIDAIDELGGEQPEEQGCPVAVRSGQCCQQGKCCTRGSQQMN